ncbi:Uncharacterized protein Adt_10655 [Abeliophyllum distichum]|uniref:Putative plant transposon protein domain-containing protein n=1 Tax=Abeliophyllum distichum TaxID=126358 RepID=A0ABD1UKM3_9LAMI
MAVKRTRSERPPSSSSSDEEDPHTKRIDRCPIQIGKNVDLASFTFDAPSINIENLFIGMGWVPILTLNDKVYPTIVKDFYTKINFSLGSGITCLHRNKLIKITHELIRSILHLEDGGVRLYTTKKIPHSDDYDPVKAFCHVIGKQFEAAVHLSTNQLTISRRILHNIISYIIVPRKGHLDEVNHYDVFLLDSILRGRKIDFSYIMMQHMSCVLSGTRPKALPYEMILTKKFHHFKISFRDSVAVLPEATDTINVLTLKRMKIFKKNGQWVVKSKGFDDESGPSTLPFEGEDMDADEDVPPSSPPRPRSHRPSSSTSGFTEDHFNLLNGPIDSLTSSMDGLHHTANELRLTMETLQQSVDGMTSLFQALYSRLDAMVPHPSPPPET